MPISRPALILSSALLAAAPRAALAGQPVTGHLTDVNTGQPVAGATVTIEGLAARATTGAEGEFTFENVPDGTWTLKATKPPLESSTDTVVVGAGGPPAPVDLVLITEMEAVKVVEKAKREQPAPGGTQVLREELVKLPGTRGDALSAVQSLPGIANTGTFTPFSSGIIVRGSDPSDARILVDGFEIPILYHFGAVQSILPSEMIQDILYAPGGFGVEHGRASSGTIEVRSRKGAPTLGGFAELSFINGAAFLQGPIGKHATFAVSLRRSVADAVLPAFLGKDSGVSFTVLPRYYDWQARVDWQPADRWKLALFVFGTDDSTSFALDRNDPADPALTGKFLNRTGFGRAIASAEYEGEKFKNKAALSFDVTKFRFQMSSDRHLNLDNAGLAFRDEAQLTLSDKLTLRGGAEVLSQMVGLDEKMPRPEREGDPGHTNFTFDPIVERKQDVPLMSVGAWASVEARLAAWAKLTSGLRYDGFLRNGSHVVQPRAELELYLAPYTVRASGGLYTRPPYWQDEILEESLKPERSWQTSLGVERDFGNSVTAQATAFFNKRSDLIGFAAANDRAGAAGENVYGNQGLGKTYGAELMLRWKGEHHFAWVAYTLSRSLRQDGPGAPERLFDFDQTHNLVLVGSRRFGKNDQWQVGGRFQLTTGKPYTPVTGSVFMADVNRYRPVYGALNSQRVETMHQLDLRVDRFWTWNTWRLSAYIDVQNVYAHATVMDYRYNFDFSEKKAVKTLPILPSFGLRAEF
jgi:outer membrane receptor protein involved in Fe transport